MARREAANIVDSNQELRLVSQEGPQLFNDCRTHIYWSSALYLLSSSFEEVLRRGNVE